MTTRIKKCEGRTARRREQSLATLATHWRTRHRTMAFLAQLSGRDALADASVLDAAPGTKPCDTQSWRRTMLFLARLSGRDALADTAVLGAAPGAKPHDAPVDAAPDDGVLPVAPPERSFTKHCRTWRWTMASLARGPIAMHRRMRRRTIAQLGHSRDAPADVTLDDAKR
jgi:hypothetical protein